MEDLLERLHKLSDENLDRLIAYLAALNTPDTAEPQSACLPEANE